MWFNLLVLANMVQKIKNHKNLSKYMFHLIYTILLLTAIIIKPIETHQIWAWY